MDTQLSIAEEARQDYARTVGNDPVYMADYDEDSLRRATYEQSVIRRRAEAEQKLRNGGAYTYVTDHGDKVKVERLGGELKVSVINDPSSNAYGVVWIPDSSALGLAAAILAHSGHEHLAAGLQAGVR